MNLINTFDQTEHDQIIIDCFLKLWSYSADLMFIMSVESNGEFTLFDNNPASREIMGLSREAKIHRMNIRDTWGDDIVEGLYSSYRKAIAAREPISVAQYATYDGKDVYVDTLLVPIFDASGNPIFVCGVSRDITKIKEAEIVALKANEKLLEYSAALETINQDLDHKVQERTKELESAKCTVEEALEAKSSFVAKMSHEIRTPINAVIGLSHLSLKTALSIEQKDYINTILSSGETLLSLVNDVLDFSKIEAGKMSIEAVPFSPRLIVQHAINMNAIKAEEKKLAVTADISPSLPPMLLGDPLRIQQVLINLVTNAVKFTECGGICVRMYTDEKNDKDVLLRCDVIDTGIGISKTYIDQLFQSFQQADDSITRQFGGTGLGLTISRQLCELMGGEIWVHSELGQGSTFSFTLPLNIASHASVYTEDMSSNEMVDLATVNEKVEGAFSDKLLYEDGDVPDFSQYHVLLAEDNLINQKVILGYLGDTSINVDVAGNGEEAIYKLNSKKYDLVLMDIQMPIMDGLAAARYIRRSSVYGNIPIIAMTAHVSDEAKEQSAQAGMNAHLDKPIQKSELYKTLQKHFEVKDTHKSIQKHDFFAPSHDSSYDELLFQLSSIDTLSVDDAIEHLNGKKSLYLDIATAFYNKYKVFSLHGFLGDDLAIVLHSLKSNSAYIGAFELSSYCAELESNIKEDVPDLHLLSRLEMMVSDLNDSLEKILTPYSSLLEYSEEAKSFNEKDLLIKLQAIVPLLKKSDFFVENYFSLLRKTVRGTRYTLDVENIIFDIKNIEFETATVKASQLILALRGDKRR
ncbi:PAS domain-containing sensor histidine kinase [Marinomonas rhizomae]|uniref:histidine kinase n=1 Tax=Marinomonas rhizomae TaxID=491948 RepID=A0A366JH72_9GAMM|nr:ATP-binding protein [Marinomonas rhizomae]RBP85799.1 PAS domain S-box-containing protein [Marinomonas rhizomae]RNF75584.1 PAS domain-containing sensor histidine kinase [Marinomonas rhizomae]